MQTRNRFKAFVARAVLTLMFGALVAAQSSVPGSAGRQPAAQLVTVSDVHDGDTLTAQDRGRVIKVRLEGIDAPELAHPFGRQSRDALANLVLHKSVTLTSHGV